MTFTSIDYEKFRALRITHVSTSKGSRPTSSRSWPTGIIDYRRWSRPKPGRVTGSRLCRIESRLTRSSTVWPTTRRRSTSEILICARSVTTGLSKKLTTGSRCPRYRPKMMPSGRYRLRGSPVPTVWTIGSN